MHWTPDNLLTFSRGAGCFPKTLPNVSIQQDRCADDASNMLQTQKYKYKEKISAAVIMLHPASDYWATPHLNAPEICVDVNEFYKRISCCVVHVLKTKLERVWTQFCRRPPEVMSESVYTVLN